VISTPDGLQAGGTLESCTLYEGDGRNVRFQLEKLVLYNLSDRYKAPIQPGVTRQYGKVSCAVFLISNFRRVLIIVCNLLGISPASDY